MGAGKKNTFDGFISYMFFLSEKGIVMDHPLNALDFHFKVPHFNFRFAVGDLNLQADNISFLRFWMPGKLECCTTPFRSSQSGIKICTSVFRELPGTSDLHHTSKNYQCPYALW